MIRIGHGYDVHKLVEGRPLILGGVEVPHELGLLGHSDADVLSHAVMDGIIGALGQGDIGRHFPDTDESYAGVSSLKLMEHVAKLLDQAGFVLGNLDVTIIAQRPKLATYIPKMQENLARILSGELGQINIKATTEEGLGFTGQGLGIAAHAVVIIQKK